MTSSPFTCKCLRFFLGLLCLVCVSCSKQENRFIELDFSLRLTDSGNQLAVDYNDDVDIPEVIDTKMGFMLGNFGPCYQARYDNGGYLLIGIDPESKEVLSVSAGLNDYKVNAKLTDVNDDLFSASELLGPNQNCKLYGLRSESGN